MIRGEKISKLLTSESPRDDILLSGWVRQKRVSKAVIFLEINDGSIIHNIQVVVDSTVGNFDEISKMFIGSSVQIRGNLINSPAKGQKYEIHAVSVTIIGHSEMDFPLQKKRHSFEFLRTIAHLRPRTNAFGAAFRVRSAAAFAIHEFFQKRGFYYINTPIISSSDCEGAGEMFRVTTLPLENVPMAQVDGKPVVDCSHDFFKAETGLTVSGQLEGECFAMAMSDIYTFGPTFRAENSNTPRHVAEFWMVEPEMAFYDLDDDIALAESFTREVVDTVLTRCGDDMAFFARWIDKSLMDRLKNLVDNAFEVITYTEAIRLLEQSKKSFEFPVKWGIDLQTEHERYLTEERFKKPVFVRDYPREIKAFYMRLNDDNKTVSAMDLLVPGIGEIIGGSQREDRKDVLSELMKLHDLDEETYWWYLDLRRYGSAPHAGFGLGFGRFVQYLTGMTNIRDVIPFPRTPGSAEF